MLNRRTTSHRLAVSAAALLALTLGPAHAQQTQPQDQQAQQQQPQEQTGGQEGAQQPGQGADALVATVGDVEVRASDVMAVIDAMPPRLRQQPQQMLVPMAIEQVVLRELILQRALSENLGEDPDVIALVEENARVAEEDAMVSIWLQREMDTRVSDQRVQEVYDRLQSEAEQELPPLEDIRPQIEQQLGREAVEGIRSELGDEISVVYYGPDGQPVETTVEAEPGTAPEDQEDAQGAGSNEAGAGTGDATGSGDAGTDDTTTGTDGGQGGTTDGQGDSGDAGTGGDQSGSGGADAGGAATGAGGDQNGATDGQSDAGDAAAASGQSGATDGSQSGDGDAGTDDSTTGAGGDQGSADDAGSDGGQAGSEDEAAD